jgi:hypothetical protein
MLQFEFNGIWNPEMEITMKNEVTGLASQCNIYLRDGDVSSPAMYGTCDINHGTNVLWNMADGTVKDFGYVDSFNLGTTDSGEGTNSDVIARYMTLTEEGNFYLWLKCDVWKDDYNRAIRNDWILSIFEIALPFVGTIGQIIIQLLAIWRSLTYSI